MSRRVVFLVAAAVFLVMPSGPVHGNPGLFLPYVVYPVGSREEAVAIGDVNSDGRNDIVVATSCCSAGPGHYLIHVFLQDSLGSLGPSVKYQGGTGHSIDIGDVDADGRADVVTTDWDGIGVLLQNEAGELNRMVKYAGTTPGRKVRIGDLNADGLLDVASIDPGSHSHHVDIFIQDAQGTLSPPVPYEAVYGRYDDLEVGDVTGDGLQDVVVMSGQGAYYSIALLPQRPDGTFDSPVYHSPVTGGAGGVAIGDVNGDALNDVVETHGGNRPRSFVSTLLQNAGGGLDPPQSYPSYDHPGPVEVADVNLDGRDDIILAHGGWKKLGVYLQEDDGGLGAEELYPIPYATRYNPHGRAVGDVNGDGAPDVAIADYNYGLVVLYHSPPDCVFRDDRGNGTRLSVWGDAWNFAGPGGLEASGTGARRHGDRVVVSGRSGNVVVSGEGMCPSGAGHFRAVELDPPRRKLRLVDLG